MSATQNFLRQGFLRWIADSIADAGLSFRGSLADSPLKKLCRDLVSERGEASGTAIAREIAERYAALNARGRAAFFESLLATNWLADADQVMKLASSYRDEPTAATLSKLFRTAEPKRMELFRRINTGPRGTETIVAMRKDLLALLRDNPDIEPLNADLTYLLSSWFNRGFLELRRIDWRTPALILEKLIEYEAVHEIQGWPDLKRRLHDDRRCFAFFHPALPDEPLIFVEIALTRGIAGAIQPLLDLSVAPGDPARANTAVFYSISNCQEGLRNISFGAFLLKQVIHELQQEQLHLRNFVTLSPIPGFRSWLAKQAPALAEAEADAAHKDELTAWCARYLTSKQTSGRAIDPVAHFHLNNGASIEQINWMADTSEKGIRQSMGFMVNYLYQPNRIERNHELYVKEGACAASGAVEALLAEPKSEPRAKRAVLAPQSHQ